MKMSRGLWDFADKVIRGKVEKKFEYSFEDFDFDAIEGPVFLVTNHVCAWDPLLIGLAVRERQLAFVASEHTLRMPKYGKLMGKYLDIIPHRKAGGGTSSVRECLQRIKKGESIFIASEGEQTWDGRTNPVVSSTGKLIKKSGATLLTMRIDGGYLAKPRWAENTRRGKIHVHHVNVYTPEEIKAMTPEEVNDAINKDLYFDIWEWQRDAESKGGMHKYIPSKGGLAEGLERMMYICPSCKALGTLKSCGDEIECTCGFKTRFTETGFLDPSEPFETISEWSDWQDVELAEMLAQRDARGGAVGDAIDAVAGDAAGAVASDAAGAVADYTIFSDEGFTLVEIANDHTERILADGRLSLVRGAVSGSDSEASDVEGDLSVGASGADGKTLYIDVAGTRFALSDISAMAMILANRIVFSTNEMYYEIRPHDLKGRMNLRKYLVAWQKSREASNNTEEV